MYYVCMTIVGTISNNCWVNNVDQHSVISYIIHLRGMKILSIRTDILQKFYVNNIILMK